MQSLTLVRHNHIPNRTPTPTPILIKEIYKEYESGKMLTGELKAILIEKINDFLKDHQKNKIEAKKNLDKFILKN